jgi:hypothetical protein
MHFCNKISFQLKYPYISEKGFVIQNQKVIFTLIDYIKQI